MNTYSIIAELELKHTYFTSGKCSAIAITPTKETSELLQKYNFMIRNIAGKYAIVAENRGSLSEYFAYINQVSGLDAFTFNLVVDQPDFFIYTDISSKQLGTYNYTTSSQTGANVLSPNVVPDKNVFGTVKLNFNDLISDKSTTYQIQFQARVSEWIYYIINRSGLALKKLAIKTSGNIAFEGLTNNTLPNGESAITFKSTEPITMAEISKVRYDLVEASQNNGLPNGKIIMKGLPQAGPINTIVNTENNEEQFTSLLYLYI